MKIKSFIVLAALSVIVYVALAAGYRQATLFDYRVGAVEYAGTRTNFGGAIPADTDGVLLTNVYYIKKGLVPASTFGVTVGWKLTAGTNHITVSGAGTAGANGNYTWDEDSGDNVWTNNLDGGIYDADGSVVILTNGAGDTLYGSSDGVQGTWSVGAGEGDAPAPTSVAYNDYSNYTVNNSNVLVTLQKSFDGSNWVSFTNFVEATHQTDAITNHSFVGAGDTLFGFGYVRCSGIYNSNIVPITNLYMHLWSKEDF